MRADSADAGVSHAGSPWRSMTGGGGGGGTVLRAIPTVAASAVGDVELFGFASHVKEFAIRFDKGGVGVYQAHVPIPPPQGLIHGLTYCVARNPYFKALGP